MTILGSTYAEFLITLAKPVKEVVRVAWSTVDFTARAGIDYEATSGVAVFAPGETEKSALVLVYPAKGTEQRAFRLKIETPINAVLGTLTVAEATIIPRDDLTDVHISVAEGPKGDTVGYQYSGNTPPPAPYAGDKWQSPADGTVYTWTVTASGGQWVEYFPGAVAQGEAPPAWDTVNAWASGDESTVISIDGKPLPSPAKVIADSEASLTALADTADEWLTGDENTTVNLGGRHVRTPAKMIADAQNVVEASLAILGYNPPVPYAPNIRLTLPNQTVEYRDQVYAPIASWLPFTTGNTFDPKKFRLISGINGADLSSPNGVLMVGNAMDKREYDKINNTPDMQKPLSIPQAAALRDLADGLVVRIEEEAGGSKKGFQAAMAGRRSGLTG